MQKNNLTNFKYFSFLIPVFGVICILFGLLSNEAFFANLISSDGQIKEALYRTYIHIFRYGCVFFGVCVLFIFCFKSILKQDWKSLRERLKMVSSKKVSAQSLLPQSSKAVFYGILALYLMFFLFLGWSFCYKRSLLVSMTVENGITETLTVLFYLGAMFMTMGLIWTQYRQKIHRGMQKWWLIGFALFFLLISGEETNWGQTYLHYKTPELLEESNFQKEMGLHNIPILYISHKDNEVHHKAYWANYLLIGIAAIFGIISPIIFFVFPSLGRFLWAVGFPLPSRIVQAGFFMAAVIPTDQMMKVYFTRTNIPSELRELLCAICFFLLIWHICYARNLENEKL